MEQLLRLEKIVTQQIVCVEDGTLGAATFLRDPRISLGLSFSYAELEKTVNASNDMLSFRQPLTVNADFERFPREVLPCFL